MRNLRGIQGLRKADGLIGLMACTRGHALISELSYLQIPQPCFQESVVAVASASSSVQMAEGKVKYDWLGIPVPLLVRFLNPE